MRKDLLIVVFTLVFCPLKAQDTAKKIKASANVSIVNNFLFRGIEVGTIPCIQGDANFTYRNFTIGTWASSDFMGKYFEPDYYAYYSKSRLTMKFYNYHVGQGKDYFNYKKMETSNISEVSVDYKISEKFPLSVLVGTHIIGKDYKIERINTASNDTVWTNNYSTYIELGYPFKINDLDLKVFAGASTHTSSFYQNKGFAFVNIGGTLTRRIKLNDTFSLPCSFTSVYNPEIKKLFSVISISF